MHVIMYSLEQIKGSNMSINNEEKNIMITGQLPTGTFKVEVANEEVLDADPRILMEMRETLSPREKVNYKK